MVSERSSNASFESPHSLFFLCLRAIDRICFRLLDSYHLPSGSHTIRFLQLNGLDTIRSLMHEETITPIAGRFFSPDGMIWQVDREMVLLLAGGRALLMQLAHPKVAAGVAEHSHFKADPLGRLYRTMGAMWSIVFDEAPAARASLEQVKNVHRRIHGIISPAESLPFGTPYDALDMKLLLWVHATLIDSAMVAYDIFVKPLAANEKSKYYDDSKKLARLFEIPETLVPASLVDFDRYMDECSVEMKSPSDLPLARSPKKFSIPALGF